MQRLTNIVETEYRMKDSVRSKGVFISDDTLVTIEMSIRMWQICFIDYYSEERHFMKWSNLPSYSLVLEVGSMLLRDHSFDLIKFYSTAMPISKFYHPHSNYGYLV